MKRKLRPSIRTALTLITMFLGMMLVSIDDFSLSALPLIMGVFGIVVLDVKILDTF